MPTVVLVGTSTRRGRSTRTSPTACASTAATSCSSTSAFSGEPSIAADIGRAEVAAAAGADVAALAAEGDRGAAVEAMARGAAEVEAASRRRTPRRRRRSGRLGGSSIVTHAMRELPVGMPKLMVSTLASGDTRPYVGAVDVTMMYSVVDIAGINQISARILSNAAGAIAGMAKATSPQLGEDKPLVGASMFGVTTPCVTPARERLEELGYEVLVFHATGTGGESMEELMKGGFITAALDVTTTELADELAGGVFPAYPDRLEVAGRLGLPQVVSLGALDMVNFGPKDTVPPRVSRPESLRPQPDRHPDAHDAGGVRRARPPHRAQAQRRHGGNGAVRSDGRHLDDRDRGPAVLRPEADEALFAALRNELAESIEVHWVDTHVNDPAFAVAMAERLHELYTAWAAGR